MKFNIVKLFVLLFVILLVVESCKRDDVVKPPNSSSPEQSRINLAFYQNDSESISQFELGLKWVFSFLGAQLDKGSWSRALIWKSGSLFELRIDELGFSENAQIHLRSLINQFKLSEEYQIKGGIDAGRFVVCILNNSNHYYKITGVPKTFSEFKSQFEFKPKKAAIIESAVAFTERLIFLPKRNNTATALGYLADELAGSLVDSTHATIEHEVMDIMDNGQLRFAVYTDQGELIVGADPRFSSAGKPVKCLWCHEINLQCAFAAISAIPGYYSPPEFDSILATDRVVLDDYRAALTPEIDYSDEFQHAELEKLYFRFMEPSAKRLAQEWGKTEAEIKRLLVGIPTHQHHEFLFNEDLYYRADIQQFSPFQVLPSTPSVRETNDDEPNLLEN